MNQNQHFDNNIKNQFKEYSPNVHPRIWENIINKRDKRKPVAFWFTFFNARNILLLSALLLALGGGSYLLLKNKTTIKDNAVAANNVQQTKIISQPNHTFNSNAQQTNKITNNSTNSIFANNNNHNIFTSPINSTNNKSSSAEPLNNLNEHKFIWNELSSNIKIANNDDIKNTEDNLNNDNQNNFLKNLFFSNVETLNAVPLPTGSLRKNNLPKIFLPDCPMAEKDAAGNKTYFEFYGGPDYAFKNLSDTGNSVYLQKRKQSATFSSAFSAGVRYTKVFSNGMSLRTGINYSQINEKFSFVQGNLVQITYIIDANGDTTGSYITTGTRYKTTINRYRTIDVPLLVGYEMGNGKFHANINAGVLVNAYSWQSGDVLDSSYQPISITTGKNNSVYQFKTNIGVGFMGAVSFYYKLNKSVHIMAEPYFRYNLAPMSTETLTLKQKYNTAGLHLGVRIDLH